MSIAALTQAQAPKRTLAGIVDDLLALIELSGGEVTANIDAIELQLEDKAQAYVAVMRQLAAEAEALAELAHEYKLKAAARETQITALKFRLDAALQAVNVEKLKTATASIYYQLTKSVHVPDEKRFLETAEDRFVKVTQAINRAAVKEALEAGEVVADAELKTSRHLRFR